MSISSFQCIGLVGKSHHSQTKATLTRLYEWLIARGHQVIVEYTAAQQLDFSCNTASINQIGQEADLAIVIGGDGNMLGASRVLARYDIGVIGVNRGNLGFLTDLPPDNFEDPLGQVLDGDYDTEFRFLIEAEVHRHGDVNSHYTAMNEVVLHPGKVAHMIEFEVFVDDKFMYSQRADGMIVSTPTGSTAYSLSAGGAILTPNIDAFILVPMFPHTLSARPIVIDASSVITLQISPDNRSEQMISCDGHITLPVLADDQIIIRRSQQKLRLIHPKHHDYFEALRSKLGWGSKLF
ncbi:NAD kinase [Paraferrimonas haliotis]|uniref:NAD kinase n=1 Tax=Paraferrimonas haliotis TaxID=2013866 RepID=A0AA37TVG3_9GAMM|nr:NAD(+) kinase [Paraferrimonas haliotis]GLS83649.1 NAD kinase [Paraferrimonas haliotis]